MNSELLHAGAQCAGVQSEQSRRALPSFNSPMAITENTNDVITFHFLERFEVRARLIDVGNREIFADLQHRIRLS